jgi:putative methylase
MQKIEIVRKINLEKMIGDIKPHPTPNVYLEQYPIPPKTAAEILFLATYIHSDIIGKTIVDLGCGTGRLAIGAALLGAKETTGIDIDRLSVRIAKRNAKMMGVKKKTQWITADIEFINGPFDTVLQNPPFGVQKRRSDRKFIIRSLKLGDVIYTLHKGGPRNRNFIEKFIENHGGKITGIFPMELEIPRLFKFHTRRKHIVKTDLYRIEGKSHEL